MKPEDDLVYIFIYLGWTTVHEIWKRAGIYIFIYVGPQCMKSENELVYIYLSRLDHSAWNLKTSWYIYIYLGWSTVHETWKSSWTTSTNHQGITDKIIPGWDTLLVPPHPPSSSFPFYPSLLVFFKRTERISFGPVFERQFNASFTLLIFSKRFESTD